MRFQFTRDASMWLYRSPAEPRSVAAAPPDHLAPRPGIGEPLAGPLHTITIITPDLAAVGRMYCDGLGMTISGPLSTSSDDAKLLGNVWGMPPDLTWEVYLLTRPAAPSATRIRVIITGTITPPIRQSWSRQELGPYGMGFPNTDVESWDAHVMGLGFSRATPEVERFPLKRTDGSDYEVLEATFNGPEFLRAIAISRQGMAQVGDVDPSTGRGGPSYGTQVVATGAFDDWLSFFTNVLDFEIRLDRMWTGYDIPFRFATLHSRGSSNGHVALASYADEYLVPGTGNRPAPPHRGMAIWSFPVKNVQTLADRASRARIVIVAGPLKITSPDLGPIEVMTLRAPSGFLIEVFKTMTP